MAEQEAAKRGRRVLTQSLPNSKKTHATNKDVKTEQDQDANQKKIKDSKQLNEVM